jgi:hypothetical protein
MDEDDFGGDCCGNCKFWLEDNDRDLLGWCCRYPPSYIGGDSEQNASWSYPKMDYIQDCGEFVHCDH